MELAKKILDLSIDELGKNLIANVIITANLEVDISDETLGEILRRCYNHCQNSF